MAGTGNADDKNGMSRTPFSKSALETSIRKTLPKKIAEPAAKKDLGFIGTTVRPQELVMRPSRFRRYFE